MMNQVKDGLARKGRPSLWMSPARLAGMHALRGASPV